MSFILDTCAISELRKCDPDRQFLSWFDEINDRELFLSSLTLGEVEYGITLLDDGRKKNDIMVWFEKVKDAFAPRTLPITANIALRWGELRGKLRKEGLELPVVDGLLAATAIEHDFILITRNVGDFRHTPTKIFSPWQ